ncbi:hypothetical protein IFM89_016116 [Coptis chinensis]|uniref:Uncharacterized protein n=1 Tax=Coptis chinensis TaxID=261450 RepID=A0A835INK7_9MAGN|nr:hypothetical protein IFM89_016116 [Coptis chinensis]
MQKILITCFGLATLQIVDIDFRVWMVDLVLFSLMCQAQSAFGKYEFIWWGVKYGGPMDVAMQVLRSEGGMIGLFKGLAPTFEHEVPGNLCNMKVTSNYHRWTRHFRVGEESMIVAGASFWRMLYSTHVVKSDYKNPKFFWFHRCF